MTDLSQAIWRKARGSADNGGCVEIAANLDGVTGIRDGKRAEGGAHVVDRDAFAVFLADAKNGRYDLTVASDEATVKALWWMQPLGAFSMTACLEGQAGNRQVFLTIGDCTRRAELLAS